MWASRCHSYITKAIQRPWSSGLVPMSQTCEFSKQNSKNHTERIFAKDMPVRAAVQQAWWVGGAKGSCGSHSKSW